jgi:NAD(P)-dependent dehydrogenase (short-subunit alcohol dehydrogenase family)
MAGLDELLPERLDAVVNNAGIGVGGPIQTVSLDDVRRQLEVNVVGQIAVAKVTLSRLRRSRGRFVFTSSLNGRVSTPCRVCRTGADSAPPAQPHGRRNDAGGLVAMKTALPTPLMDAF